MPNWKKIIVSGSDAALNSLYSPSITGSLHGTASYAIYAETASFSFRTTQTDVLVLNQTGFTINKGTVVRITGSNNASDIPRITTASYENDNQSANTLGITTQQITNGSTGYIITEGVLTGIDTSVYTSGQLIFLGATGSLTGSAPIAPLHAVRLGQIIRQQSNNGSMHVRIDNGYELNELHDVLIQNSSSGDLLIQSGSVWINSKQLSGSYGLTGSLNATSFTGSLLGTAATASYVLQAVSASFASTASSISISNDANDRVATANGNGTLNAEGNLTFNGQTLSVLYGVGDEGGEILLGKAATNTTLTGSGVTVDVYQNKLRFFEQGGSARGFYLDISTGGGGASTNLASGGGTVTSVDTAGSVNGITLTGGPVTGAGTITLGGTLSNVQSSQLATSSLMIGTTNIALGATGSTLAGLTSVTATNFIGTASYATTALSASYAPSTPTFPYTGSAQITGSLRVTGSFTTQTWNGASYVTALSFTDVKRGIFDLSGVDSIDANTRELFDIAAVSSINWDVRRLFDTSTSRSIDWENRYLHDNSGTITADWNSALLYDTTALNSINWNDRETYDSAEIPSITWEARRLFDDSGVASIRWGLRSAYDTVDSQSIAWDARLLKINNGPGAYTVNWGSGILRDTSAKNSVDWENRTTIDTGNKNSIDWENRKLLNTAETELLNWQNQITITGSATVSGSLTVTGSLLITGSGTLINQGPTILSGSFAVQGNGDGFSGPFAAITVDDANYTRKLHDSQTGSGSLDFGTRDLLDGTGNGVFNWNGIAKTIDSRLYLNETISGTTRNALITNVGYGGFALNDSEFDVAVQTNDLVFLDTDGIWYQVNQTTNTSTKMLGICQSFDPMTNIGIVITEGDIIVTTGTGYPVVAGANYGLPVYIKESGGTLMSTTIPTTGYVRLLGHCYHNAGGTEWIMKFRPSHEWYVI